jgi:hypothetical protein
VDDLAEKDRQDDGNWKGENKAVEAYHKGVSKSPPEFGFENRIEHEFGKIIKSAKIAAQNAPVGLVILKGYQQPAHGFVDKEDEPYHHRGQKAIETPVPAKNRQIPFTGTQKSILIFDNPAFRHRLPPKIQDLRL